MVASANLLFLLVGDAGFEPTAFGSGDQINGFLQLLDATYLF